MRNEFQKSVNIYIFIAIINENNRTIAICMSMSWIGNQKYPLEMDPTAPVWNSERCANDQVNNRSGVVYAVHTRQCSHSANTLFRPPMVSRAPHYTFVYLMAATIGAIIVNPLRVCCTTSNRIGWESMAVAHPPLPPVRTDEMDVNRHWIDRIWGLADGTLMPVEF